MTKVSMPAPVATARRTPSGITYKHKTSLGLRIGENDLITTAQAEAYADARVREALEEAANAVADPVYIEAAIENFAWVSHGNYVRAHHILRDAVEAIRALIPDK